MGSAAGRRGTTARSRLEFARTALAAARLAGRAARARALAGSEFGARRRAPAPPRSRKGRRKG
jgi:hypothetical protein